MEHKRASRTSTDSVAKQAEFHQEQAMSQGCHPIPPCNKSASVNHPRIYNPIPPYIPNVNADRIGTRYECDKDKDMALALGEPRLTKPLIGNK